MTEDTETEEVVYYECNSCGEECDEFDECCPDGEVVPSNDIV